MSRGQDREIYLVKIFEYLWYLKITEETGHGIVLQHCFIERQSKLSIDRNT